MVKLDDIVHNKYSGKVTSLRRYSRLIPVAIIVAFLLSLISNPVFADPGLKVGNAAIVITVSPGQTFTQKMTVSIGSNDPATNISVQVAGVQQSPEGAYILLNASQDTGPYSARSFISVDKSSFHLKPGGSQDVTVTIQIPQDVGDGGRYAIINIATQPVAGAGVNIITAVNVLVYLTIQGSQLIQQGKITVLNVGEATSGQPVNISTTFQNTGNHHFKVKGEVTVKNAQGQSLGNISIPVTSSSLLPGVLRQLKAAFIPNGELAQGTYTVSSQVMLEDGTLLDEANTTLEITSAYMPPPAMGNITLTPSSASTLTSADGNMSIYFPQGAVLAPVTVSISSYSVEQLPTPPAGTTLTGTCFQVDGLTGLLAKEATVSVKYSAADLDKAGGDASRLRLARWDEGVNQWTVLKTNVDEGAMTLSATSNQMSIWAVVVAAPTPAEVNWVTPVATAVAIIVVAIVAILFVTRRRRQGKAA